MVHARTDIRMSRASSCVLVAITSAMDSMAYMTDTAQYIMHITFWCPIGPCHLQVPESLVASLAPGGRMVIPVGPEEGPQYLMVIDRTPDGQIKEHNAGGVMYVPLTSQDHQLRRAGAR